MARQAARCVLPNATETKIFVTANARALRHFIELRGNEHAEAEIREVAALMLDVLRKEAQAVFGDYETQSLPDGSRAASTPFTKCNSRRPNLRPAKEAGVLHGAAQDPALQVANRLGRASRGYRATL